MEGKELWGSQCGTKWMMGSLDTIYKVEFCFGVVSHILINSTP